MPQPVYPAYAILAPLEEIVPIIERYWNLFFKPLEPQNRFEIYQRYLPFFVDFLAYVAQTATKEMIHTVRSFDNLHVDLAHMSYRAKIGLTTMNAHIREICLRCGDQQTSRVLVALESGEKGLFHYLCDTCEALNKREKNTWKNTRRLRGIDVRANSLAYVRASDNPSTDEVYNALLQHNIFQNPVLTRPEVLRALKYLAATNIIDENVLEIHAQSHWEVR